MTGDEQGGFRAGRGCVDQIFTLKQIGEKAREKKRKVYVSFIDMEKTYDRVNRVALWQVLRMYDLEGEGKPFSGIKGMYIDSLACVRVKRGESEQFRIYSGVIYGWSGEGGEDDDGKGGSELSGEWERVEIAWPLICR